ncbi:hypothetical protein MMC13_001531 [Lambiella insularis]|nr:hypothetical protein [Lambiella insularis]
MTQRSPNPLVLSPASRFVAKDYTPVSRSPSRSPTRRQEFTAREIDPLLSNLSPISTLEALQATDAIVLAPGSRQRVLSESIADASTSDRAFAIRAALAGKKLREWYNEVKEWQWPPTGFEEPTAGGKLRSGEEVGHGGYLDNVLADDRRAAAVDSDNDDGYWGSLPAHVVRELEDRIETIRDDMETLDVEELKEHVRGAHHVSRSRSSSIYDAGPLDSPFSTYSHLDDFTMVITATIMQALPHISRLNSLLDVWFVRLVVLRQVPGFLRQLDDARTAVDSAWNVIASSQDSSIKISPNINRRDYLTMKSVLQDRVVELGQRLDAMLDALEGSLDRLPDHWIDDMERVQEDYETWVVNAERLVDENDWKLQQETASFLASLQPQTADELSNDLVIREKQEKFSNREEQDQLRDRSDFDHLVNGNHVNDTIQKSAVLDHKKSKSQPHDPDEIQSDLLFRNQYHEPILATLDGASGPDGAYSNVQPILGELLEVFQRPNRIQADGTLTPSTGKRSPLHRPSPLELQQQAPGTDSTVSSEFSEPGSATSNYSNMSSPEILDAARVEYFKTPTEDKKLFFPPKDFTSPHDNMSRHSSQRTERSVATMKEATTVPDETSSMPRSRASSFVPEPTIFESGSNPNHENTEKGLVRPDLGIKRASATSIEVLSRSELRNIMVRRSGSQSSNSSAFSRRKSDSAAQEPPPNFSSLRGQVEHGRPSPSQSRSGTPLLEHDLSPSIRASKRRHSFFNTLSDSTFTTSPPSRSGTPLQTMSEVEAAASSPQKETKEGFANTPSASPETLPNPPERPSSPRKMTLSPSQSIEEQLTARITSILTHIPARIRLTSSDDADTSKPLPLTPSSTSPLPTTAPLPPPLTLAPAPKTPKSRLQTDPDIQLYHLHQPGATQPIKLYVRLVGEAGERVMVRVGGGWADLAEYLREYASHHGRRAVSDSRFEISSLPSSPGTPASRPASPPSLGVRRLRVSSGAGTLPRTPEGATTDAVTRGKRASAERGKRAEEEAPLGLAGPKSRQVVISPGKRAWVDGMLDQARRASGGESRGTRRVFLRGREE